MFSYVLQNTQCIWMYYLSTLSGTGLAPSMQSHCIKLYFHPQCLSALLVCIFANIRYCGHFHVSCGGASAACYTADLLGFHWLLVRVTQHPVACLMGDLAILFYEVPPESGIYYYCESVWLRHSMPQPACGGLWRRFSPYTLQVGCGNWTRDTRLTQQAPFPGEPSRWPMTLSLQGFCLLFAMFLLIHRNLFMFCKWVVCQIYPLATFLPTQGFAFNFLNGMAFN